MNPLRTGLVFSGLAAVALTVACSSGGTSRTAAALPMQNHFDAANRLQHAMIQGDLGAARDAARAIENSGPVPGLDWDAASYLDRMRESARQVRMASRFDEAAEASAELAATCGACHIRGGGPTLEGATTAPAQDEDTRMHMVRHAWALDRMWEGLVTPSVDRWQAGARVLAESPIHAMEMTQDVGLLAARVHEMGQAAMDDRTPHERAERFAGIVSTCASCHAELEVR